MRVLACTCGKRYESCAAKMTHPGHYDPLVELEAAKQVVRRVACAWWRRRWDRPRGLEDAGADRYIGTEIPEAH